MTIELRYYQADAVAAARKYMAAGGRAGIAVIPTGGGKSLSLAQLALDCVRSGRRALILADVQELIKQNYDAVRQLDRRANVGIYSAGVGYKHTASAITVAGVQSLFRNPEVIGKQRLVLIDEAHMVSRKASGMYSQLLTVLRELDPELRLIGMSATPYRMDSGHICEPYDSQPSVFGEVCYEVSIRELIDAGYLSPMRAKSTNSQMEDASKQVQMRGGEFVAGQIEAAVNVDEINAAIVEESLALGRERKTWLTFACGIAHANALSERFNLAGIESVVLSGDTPKAQRDQIVKAHKEGRLRNVVNVGVACLDMSTEILTRRGWIGPNEILPSDLVANWHPDSRITWSRPKQIIRKPLAPDEFMVSLRSNSVDIRVTNNHRMARFSGRGKLHVEEAGALVGKPTSLPASGFAAPVRFESVPECLFKCSEARFVSYTAHQYRSRGLSAVDARFHAQMQLERKLSLRKKSPHELSISECQFIGFWLGDGSRGAGNKGGQVFNVVQSENYPNIISWVNRVISDCGFDFTITRTAPSKRSLRSRRPAPLVRWHLPRGTGGLGQNLNGVYSIEDYLDKTGSDLLWGLDGDQFRALLEGFWMADGNHGSEACYELARSSSSARTERGTAITGTQKPLYDLLQAIGSCRGMRMSLSPDHLDKIGRRLPNQKPQWVLRWKDGCRATILKQATLQAEPREDDEVWCVEVDSGFIVTRRGGKVSVVGNCKGYDCKQIDFLCIGRPTASRGLYYQIVGRGFRTFPGKEDCLVADFGGNLKRHGPLDLMDVPVPPRRTKDQKLPPEFQMVCCANCNELYKRSETQCPSCKAPAPPKVDRALSMMKKLTTKAASGDLLSIPELAAALESGQFAAQVFAMRSIMLQVAGADKKLYCRVVYDSNKGPLSLWLKPDGRQWQRELALNWWNDHIGPEKPMPDDPEEFKIHVEVFWKQLTTPEWLVIKKNDAGFFEIVKWLIPAEA